jgi:hypothetical protein
MTLQTQAPASQGYEKRAVAPDRKATAQVYRLQASHHAVCGVHFAASCCCFFWYAGLQFPLCAFRYSYSPLRLKLARYRQIAQLEPQPDWLTPAL